MKKDDDGSTGGFMLSLLGGLLLLLSGASHFDVWTSLGFHGKDIPTRIEGIAHDWIPSIEGPVHTVASAMRWCMPFGAILVIIGAFLIKGGHLVVAHGCLILGAGCGFIELVIALAILAAKDTSIVMGLLMTFSLLGTLLAVGGLAVARMGSKKRR